MAESRIVKSDFRALNKFVQGLTGPKFVVKVGILGNKTARHKDELTNAELGLIHEFGAGRIPPRSFLRLPLFLKSREIIAEASEGFFKFLWKGDMKPVLAQLGVACENAIQDAFGSMGFGQWPQNAYSTILRKLKKARKNVWQRKQLAAEVLSGGATHTMPLIDSGQLRRSISSKVERASDVS